MIYLDNNTATQDLFIPRQSQRPASGSSDWASREYVNDLVEAEEQRAENTYAKKTALSAYTPTTGFTTINGQSITDGGDITIEGTTWYAGDNIEIENATISVTGIPTEFKTINGSAITGNGDITIEGKVYSAGDNIEIDENDTISVTGITVPTAVSELENDADYVSTTTVDDMIGSAKTETQEWVEQQGYLTEHQSLSAYSTTQEVEDMVSAATASTTGWVESQGYLTEHQSLSAYSTTQEVEGMVSAATAATTGWVSSQGYLTEHQSLSAYTPTSGFSTINGSAITNGSAIVIDSSAKQDVTQAQYDAMVSAGTIDPDTIYVITDAPTIDIDDLSSKKLQELLSAPSSPSDGDIVNLADGLYKYSASSAQTAWWSFTTSGSIHEQAYSYCLVYSHIPDGTTLFKYKYRFGSVWRVMKFVDNQLKVYEEDETTVVYTISKGQSDVAIQPYSNSNTDYVKFEDGYIGVNQNNAYFDYSDIWDCITNGPHYAKVVIPESNPYNRTDNQYGIPRINSNGKVTGIFYNVTTSSPKINNNYVYFIMSSGSVPNFWAPTTGGTTGQILISQGTAAPIWSNWIKSVQITSDAYDALVQAGTTDPNTLYLIVDE